MPSFRLVVSLPPCRSCLGRSLVSQVDPTEASPPEASRSVRTTGEVCSGERSDQQDSGIQVPRRVDSVARKASGWVIRAQRAC